MASAELMALQSFRPVVRASRLMSMKDVEGEGTRMPTAMSHLDNDDDHTPQPGSGETLIPHKDHFHLPNGNKVAGPGTLNEQTGELEYGHKDHFHNAGKRGSPKINTGLDNTSEYGKKRDSDLPTEEDVVQKGLEAQRAQLAKRGRGRRASVMHGKAGNTLG